jgi:hypothetical protein
MWSSGSPLYGRHAALVLARSEVYAHAASAQIWRSRVSHLRSQVKSKSGTTC